MNVRKLKVSVTLSASLLRRIDRTAAAGESRSGVIERWLERASRLEAERELEEATALYYESLTKGERAEDEALAQALSRRAKKLAIDDEPARPRPRRRRPGSRS